MKTAAFSALLVSALAVTAAASNGQQTGADLPATDLRYGAFTARFAPDGVFTLQGQGWPTFKGTWKREGIEVVVVTTGGPPECAGPGRYRAEVQGTTVALTLVSDTCAPRQVILGGSTWRPEGTAAPVPERRIVRTGPARAAALPKPAAATGTWPSFRGPQASGIAARQNLPERWDVKTGENIRWTIQIPGLAHSSPVVWGDRVFVTTAISSKGGATFKPGLYGDGDASDDRSAHKWMLYAIDARSGRITWERVAFEGEPRNKRHIKSTYASASPATDGRIVVVWFGSQGVHAYDMNGNRLWQVDIGRVDMGAYDIPSVEWGPASSPIIWKDLVILQVDTQADSFLLALNAASGETVWKTDRTEIPSWGTPTVISTPSGDELVTNASNYIRGYDPRTGQELWKLGGSSKITAPTPFASGDLVFIASGRRPEQPVFAVRAGSRGDLTLQKDQSSSAAVAWSKTGRGSYMPTPLAYEGVLYVLANNGILDAYDAQSGAEIYRQRLDPVGSGFSASPVAADGRIYLSGEDGDITVLAAGREFKKLGSFAMGDLLMATPAIADGVMYVRSAGRLIAVSRTK